MTDRIQLKNNKLIQFTNAVYALCLTVVALSFLFYPVSFEIPQGATPLIGQATKENVLVGARVSLLYKLVFVGSIVWVFSFWLIRKIHKMFLENNRSYFTGLLYAVPMLSYVYLQVTGSDVAHVVQLLLGLFLLDWFWKIVSGRALNSKFLRSNISFELALVYAFLFYILFAFLYGHNLWILDKSVLILLIFQILVLTISALLKIDSSAQVSKVFLLFSAGIPVCIFLSLEVHILSLEKSWFILGYKKLFFLFQLLWIILGWFILRKYNWNHNLIFSRILVPSLIFAYSMLIFYQPLISASQELFELANPANASMRILKFGEIPLLDFMSSHMLSEQWYPLLYQTIFGVDDTISFSIYAFLNLFFFFLVIYWILIRVGLNSRVGLLFLFFFPLLHHVFFSPVTFVFLVLFATQRLFLKPSATRVFLLIVLLLALVVWRIDTGVVAVFTSLFFVPIYWWISKINLRPKELLKGTTAFFGLLLGLFSIALLLRPFNQIKDNFLNALHYIKGSQAHGYAEIFNGSYHQFFVFHILFVLVAVVLIFFIIYTLKKSSLAPDNRNNLWLVFSLFSFIVFLANAQRGLVRHGFAELNELFFTSTFFLGIGFFCVHFVQSKTKEIQFSLLFSVLFFGFVGTKVFPFFPDSVNFSKLLKMSVFKDLNNSLSKEQYSGRVIDHQYFKELHYDDLKRFMDKYLKKNESFIDFSNTPMLYFYCQRNVPGYFNQNLQNTIDDFSQLQLLKSFENAELPLTVYSSYPPGWFDNTDGIPNTVRYYLVAEYIFKNYEPLGVLNNYSIWGQKTRIWKDFALQDSLIYEPKNQELGYICGWQGNKFSKSNLNPREFTILSEIKPYSKEDSDLLHVDFSGSILENKHVTMVLKMNANQHGGMKNSELVFRNMLGEEVHRVSLTRDDNLFEMYEIRLSNHYFWHQNKTLQLDFHQFQGLEKVVILKDNRVEH